MNKSMKRSLIDQNVQLCKIGMYKNLPIKKTLRNVYNECFHIDPPYEYAAVDVSQNHVLDVAYEFCVNGFKPVILNIVDPQYTGGNMTSTEGFKDEIIFVRTNINLTVLDYGLYPLKGTEVTYAPMVHVIRNNNNLHVLPPNQIFRISVISTSLIKCRKYGELSDVEDYIKSNHLMEAIFQTAKIGGNDVLILNDFGCVSGEYSIDDVVYMINNSIYKYGHLFKHIIVAIHVNNDNAMGYYNKITNGIVRPQIYLNEYVQSNPQFYCQNNPNNQNINNTNNDQNYIPENIVMGFQNNGDQNVFDPNLNHQNVNPNNQYNKIIPNVNNLNNQIDQNKQFNPNLNMSNQNYPNPNMNINHQNVNPNLNINNQSNPNLNMNK